MGSMVAMGTLVLAADAAAPAGGTRTLLDYVQAGGVVGYVLLTISVAALSLVIFNFFQLRLGRMAPVDIVMEINRLMREGDVAGVNRVCADPAADCFLTRVLRGAIGRCQGSPFGFLEIRTALEESGQRELDTVSRPTDALGLIASLGPMMGLLGTVIGMIGAFATIGEAEGAARSQMLATYMSLALVTTAEGLIVAIPCTFAYALFKKRTERLGSRIGDMFEEWIPLFGSNNQPAPAPRAVAPMSGHPMPGQPMSPTDPRGAMRPRGARTA